MTRPSRELDVSPQRLRHIRWIGGGSGAGKSTVARLLAANHGLRLYSTDDMQSAHAARSNPADHPLLHAFLAMTMDERWAKRTPEEMFRTFHGFHGEGFELLLGDLLDLPTDLPILVEGYKLLPRLVAPLLSRPNQAVWLIPTPEFRRTALASRGSTWSIAGRTSDPETALANLCQKRQRDGSIISLKTYGMGSVEVFVLNVTRASSMSCTACSAPELVGNRYHHS